MYFLYILRCADNSLYTGITTDLERRIYEHNHSDKGAKYTKARRPVTCIYHDSFPDRSSASKQEYAMKKMCKKDKELFLLQQNNL